MNADLDMAPLHSAEAWVVELEMPYPLRLGPLEYRTRDYVILRLTDANGVEGVACGYTRYTPLLESLRPLLAALDITSSPQSAIAQLKQRFIPGWAALVRGASMIEIALSDLASRRAHKPVADVIAGGSHDARPGVAAMAVAGYFADVRPESQILDEVDRFVADGFSIIKMELPGRTAAGDIALLERTRDRLPASITLAADFHGMFTEPADFAEYAAGFHDLGLLFLEDPFSSLNLRGYRPAAAAAATPLAAGEDMASITAYDDVADDGVRFIRIDSTTVGGLSDSARWLRNHRGGPTSALPHVWPWVHDPLAAAFDGVEALEVIPAYVGAEPLWGLMTRQDLPLSDGLWQCRREPGLGWNFDFDAVERAATAHETYVFQRHSG